MNWRARLVTNVGKVVWLKSPSNNSTVDLSVTHNQGAAPQDQEAFDSPVGTVTCTQTHNSLFYMHTHNPHMHAHINHPYAYTYHSICIHTMPYAYTLKPTSH